MFGKHHKPETVEKIKKKLKGRVAWNKGTKGVMKAWNKGQRRWWKSPTEFKKGHDVAKFIYTKPRKAWNKGGKGLSGGFPKGKHNLKNSGKNNWNWKGGVTKENHKIRYSLEYRMVAADSKKRDDYTCQMPGCGVRGGKLESHHIKTFKNYPDLRNDIKNLITLCRKCHLSTLGKEEKYEELFNQIIITKYHGR